MSTGPALPATSERLHALDAVRAFALLLGIAFHATMSFLPGFGQVGWPIIDSSPSTTLGVVFFVSHMFRMTTFFFIAGFFARLVLGRRGPAQFFRDRSRRILVPLVVGWLLLFPAISLVMYWALVVRGLPSTPPPAPPGTLLPFPLTHLWFLYVLFGMYLVFVPARALFVRLVDRSEGLRLLLDRAVATALGSGLAPLLLALPVALSLYATPWWSPWFGIPTPDMSLIPNLPAAAGYGTAFAFGWALHRQAQRINGLLRHWPLYLVAALALTGYCLFAVGLQPAFDLDPGPSRSGYAIGYGMAGWCWTFGITGAALRFLKVERPGVRYLADASYWLYLLHLPLVFALQVWVMQWDLHWSLKYPLILTIAMALLLLSYDLLVRSSYIGEVLNGRRYARALRRLRATGDDASHLPADLDQPPGELPATLTAVRKRFRDAIALDGIDLQVGRGELVALLGPNGAGKTTAISLLLGLQDPDAGRASLFGESPHALTARRRIGVMMQEVAMAPELKVRELVDQAASYYPAPLGVEEALTLTGLDTLAGRPYSKLSGGQKRQVQFAVAVCGRPELLFLDEPTVGLDLEARRRMWRTIRALVADGCAVLLTTHYLEEAEALADRVVVLNRGQVIAAGSVGDIRSVVSRRRISCRTSLALEELRGWPEVQHAERSNALTTITTSAGEQVVRRLLTADLQLEDLEVQRAGLSEAFSQLTEEKTA